MKRENSNYLQEFSNCFERQLEKDKNYNIEDLNNQQMFYERFQPTGLLYGAPVVTNFTIGDESFMHLKDKTKVKYTFLAAIFSASGVREGVRPIDIVLKLAEFYTLLYNKDEDIFFKKLSKELDVEDAGKIIKKRILKSSNLKKYFSFKANHNCMLFLDIIFFWKWLQVDDMNKRDVVKSMSETYLIVLKLLSASAWANDKLEKSEKYIYKGFIHSTQFNKKERKAARAFIKDRVTLDEIDFSFADNWLIKKYMLELAIFAIYSDRMVEDTEKKFLKELSLKLSLEETDLEASLIAVESFMVKNWNKIGVLKYKSHAGMVYGDLKNRIIGIGKRYKASFITEIKESKELMGLINKSRKESLSKEEKDKVKEQLIDIVKTIPALSVTLLPGGTVILFALYEILPDEFLPSGFKNSSPENLNKK